MLFFPNFGQARAYEQLVHNALKREPNYEATTQQWSDIYQDSVTGQYGVIVDERSIRTGEFAGSVAIEQFMGRCQSYEDWPADRLTKV